jgi:anti-sigma factor RsiW
MNCLKIADLYAYIEGELSPAQAEIIQRHLSSCPKCRKAFEERELLFKAASSLPDLDIPAGFTERVMAEIAPVKRRLPVWLVACAAGLASLGLFFIVFLVSGGKNSLVFLGTFNHTFWGNAKNAAVVIAQAAVILSSAVTVLNSLALALNKGFALFTTLISPGARIFILTSTLVLTITLAYALRKKFMFGEKT